jgi:hypothetical protein
MKWRCLFHSWCFLDIFIDFFLSSFCKNILLGVESPFCPVLRTRIIQQLTINTSTNYTAYTLLVINDYSLIINFVSSQFSASEIINFEPPWYVGPRTFRIGLVEYVVLDCTRSTRREENLFVFKRSFYFLKCTWGWYIHVFLILKKVKFYDSSSSTNLPNGNPFRSHLE